VKKYIALIACLTLTAGSVTLGKERLPLQKGGIKIKTGALAVPPQLAGFDKSGNPIYRETQPEIVDQGGGKYLLKWKGSRGEPLSAVYERSDMIDVVVEAAVSDDGGQFEYRYKVRNLESSLQGLGGFAIQTFSRSVASKRDPRIYFGKMSNLIPGFREDQWFRFGILEDKMNVNPGHEVELIISSPDPPGLVECTADGARPLMKGAEEEMPEVFSANLPGYEIWPRGWTIGPDSRLTNLSRNGRVKYLQEHLPEMLRFGWIEDQQMMRWYVDNLKPEKISEVRSRAQEDFNRQQITSEVLALVTYLLSPSQ